jgi:hypothetical protein
MNTNPKDAWDGTWEDTKADAYINSADIVVVERRRLIKILFDHQFTGTFRYAVTQPIKRDF